MNVTALLAHPDDELMCAGTLARFVAEGHHVRLIIGFFSDFGADHEKQGLRDERFTELAMSAAALGVRLIPVCRSDEADFDWSQGWVQAFEKLVEIEPPDLLISHRPSDPNTSHGHLGRLARTLTRKNRMSLWEVDQPMPGGIEPDAAPPNHFVDITDFWDQKERAIHAYKSQLERYPGLSNALWHRDCMYGWMVGMSHYATKAEAFRIVKSVML